MPFSRAFSVHVLRLALLAALAAFAARADTGDRLIDGARLCTRYLPQQEQHYGIPSHLLTAIAATESGRYHRQLDMPLPWPWTINAEGKGYYFDSKREAIEAVRKFQRQGIRSIDVGCMQVNLYHHPEAFSSLSQAFEPSYNVAYAARFLRENFEKDRSWRGAAASYHSRTESLRGQYAGRVFANWRKILNVASRGDKGSIDRYMRHASAQNGHPQAAPHSRKAVEVNPGKRHGLALHRSPRMKIIKVSRPEGGMALRKARGVTVVRPAPSAEAEAQPTSGGGGESDAPGSAAAPETYGQFRPRVNYVDLGHVTTAERLPKRAGGGSVFVFQ